MPSLHEVAVEYCIDKGLDPQESVQYPDPNGYAVVRKKSRWMVVAEEFAVLHDKLSYVNRIDSNA